MKQFGTLFVLLCLALICLPLAALSFSPKENAALPKKSETALSLPDQFTLLLNDQETTVSDKNYLLAFLAAAGVTSKTPKEAVKALAISGRSQAFSTFYEAYLENENAPLSLTPDEALLPYLDASALPWSEEEKETFSLWIEETEGLLLMDDEEPVLVTVPLAVAEKLAEDGDTAEDILLLFGEGNVVSFS